MIVTYGRRCPPGFLPVYSVDTEEEAERLLVHLPSNWRGEKVADELAHEQTLENLAAFGDRLHELWLRHVAPRREQHEQRDTSDSDNR